MKLILQNSNTLIIKYLRSVPIMVRSFFRNTIIIRLQNRHLFVRSVYFAIKPDEGEKHYTELKKV